MNGDPMYESLIRKLTTKCLLRGLDLELTDPIYRIYRLGAPDGRELRFQVAFSEDADGHIMAPHDLHDFMVCIGMVPEGDVCLSHFAGKSVTICSRYRHYRTAFQCDGCFDTFYGEDLFEGDECPERDLESEKCDGTLSETTVEECGQFDDGAEEGEELEYDEDHVQWAAEAILTELAHSTRIKRNSAREC